MFSSVSWSQYFTVLLIVAILYYLYVWIVYFNATLPSFPGAVRSNRLSIYGGNEAQEEVAAIQHIINELKPLFPNKQNKSELILALQLRLNSYKEWTEPGFRETINGFIAAESLATCSIRLSEEDIRVIWL